MRIKTAVFSLLISSSAYADGFVSYTDGRVGGCFVNNGFVYGCTPQPAPEPQEVYVPVPYVDPIREAQREAELRQHQIENAALRQRLQNEYSRQSDEAAYQQRAINAWSAPPEGRAAAAQQRAADALGAARAARVAAEQLDRIHASGGDAHIKASDCAKHESAFSCDMSGCRCVPINATKKGFDSDADRAARARIGKQGE